MDRDVRARRQPERHPGTHPLSDRAGHGVTQGDDGERIGPGAPFWLPPSADITIHLFGDAGPGWLLAHNRARWAGDGYASVEVALWDPERGLVAYATQVMVFSFPDGPPSPAQRRPRASN